MEKKNKSFLLRLKQRKPKIKFSLHYFVYTILFLIVSFSVLQLINFAQAVTPNPGHPWSEIGDGVFAVTNNQTAVRTYTFPDADSIVATWGGNILGVKKTIGSTDNFDIGFITNNSERVTILNNGKVGIGITTPFATLTNNGSTAFSTSVLGDFPTGGSIGTASSTVDVRTSFNIGQTTASQTITIPSPTDTTAGRIIILTNTGSVAFTVLSSNIADGDSRVLVWDGSAWTFSGDGPSSGINGTGTAGKLAKFTASGTIGDSLLAESGDDVNLFGAQSGEKRLVLSDNPGGRDGYPGSDSYSSRLIFQSQAGVSNSTTSLYKYGSIFFVGGVEFYGDNSVYTPGGLQAPTIWADNILPYGSGSVSFASGNTAVPQVIINNTTNSIDEIGLVIMGSASQTADLLQIQDSGATALLRVEADGSLHATDFTTGSGYGFLGDGGFSWTDGGNLTSINSSGLSVDYIQPTYGVSNSVNFVSGASGFPQVIIDNTFPLTDADSIGLVIKGGSSQSANLQEWQNSSGTVLASIKTGGGAYFSANSGIGAAPASNAKLTINTSSGVNSALRVTLSGTADGYGIHSDVSGTSAKNAGYFTNNSTSFSSIYAQNSSASGDAAHFSTSATAGSGDAIVGIIGATSGTHSGSAIVARNSGGVTLTGRAYTVDNASTESAYINFNGSAYFSSNVAIKGTSTGTTTLTTANTGASNYTATFQAASGTVAYLSDVSTGYVPYTGATTNVDLNTKTLAVGAITTSGLFTSSLGTFASTVANGGSAIGFTLNTPAYTTTAKLLSLQNNSVEMAHFLQNGSLTLGNSTVNSLLTINANGAYNDSTTGLRFQNSSNTAQALYMGYDYSLDKGYIQAVHDSVAYTALLLNPNGGNVGIGTISPSEKLELYSGRFGLNRGNLTFTQESAPGAPTVATGAAGVLTGAYKYKISFYTGGSVGQTQAGTASATVNPSSQKVELTNIPTGTSATTQRWIYRTVAGGSVYYYLAAIADNTTTTYSDNTADGSLSTTISPSMNTTAGLFQVGSQSIFIADAAAGNTAIGYQAGNGFRDQNGQTGVGFQAGYYSNGAGSTYLGYQAGIGVNTAPLTANPYLGIFLGYRAGFSLTTGGTRSVYITANSSGTTTGAQNTIIGIEASGGTSDTNSIGLGYAVATTASNQLVIGGNTGGGVTDGYIGNGVTATSPNAFTLNASGGSGTNIAGANFILAGGKATGNAVGGDVIFKTSDAGASGTTLQSLTTKMILKADGKVGVGTASPSTLFELGSSDLGDGTAGPVLTLGRNTNGTNTGAGSINFMKKDGTAGYVWQDAAGNMRINTSAPSNANDTAGTVIGTQTSTRETKQDIADYTDYSNALNMIVNAPLHTFRYINEVNGYGTDSPLAKTRVGFIADEVDSQFMVGNAIDQVSINGLLMASVKALNLELQQALQNNQPASFGDYAALFFSDVLINVENGVAYMKGLMVETLKVGSREKRTGVTLYDEISGDPYCISIENGVQKIAPGECTIIASPVVTSGGSGGGGGTGGTGGTGGSTGGTTDTTSPVISLNGENPLNLLVGDTYSELGATATDDIDDTVAVIVSGSVDTTIAGAYIITYNATDVAGNVATLVERTVNVTAP